MSTRINSLSGWTALDVSASHLTGVVHIAATSAADRVEAGFHRDNFLAAIESELGVRIVPADAIVIERSELPEVRVQGDSVTAGRSSMRITTINGESAASRARRRAIDELALAEYAAAHPPIDEAAVTALADLVKAEVFTRQQESGESVNWHTIARRLYLAGVRAPEVKS